MSSSPVFACVVIAAYNAGDTLGAQLDALVDPAQHREGVEILVCDNGSSDATAALVASYTARGAPVRLIDAAARRGPAAARNIGAAVARSEVLLFCDADDVVAPGWTTAMLTALHSADLVAGALDGRSLNATNRASVSWEVSSDIRMPFWSRYGAGASSNLGVRRSVFDAVGGFDERLRTAEDIDLCWRVQLAGFSFARADAAVVRSRQRDGRRAVFRQAYSYGAGSRALRTKYARHIEADRGRQFPREHTPPPIASSRSLPARLARVLTGSGQADLAWRLGERLGARYGAVDPRIVSLPID